MTLWPSPADLQGISTHQGDALGAALASPVAILTGGPGVGKTHTAASLMHAIARQYGPHEIAVCAPTGKAAVRITAAMQEHHLPLEAKTIHRTLGVGRNGHDGKGWGFIHGKGCPLPNKFVVCDEFSMTDTDLCASLLSALPPGTHLLLIGDPGQIPPVGHGAPLRDLLAAGLPQGELTEMHRAAGDVVKACHAIRRGERWEPSGDIDVDHGHNLRHIECPRSTWTLNALDRLIQNLPAGIDPRRDVQVLVAVNEKSDLGRVPINKRLQAILNPSTQTNGSGDNRRMRLGDKVICLSNMLCNALGAASDVDVPPEAGEKAQEFVANGDIGLVVEVGKRGMAVQLECPSRLVEVVGEQCKEWDLAWAITTHKAQGSEWGIVVYLIDDYAGARWVSSREHCYTALSRTRRLCVTIGRRATMDADCKRVALVGRKTFLVELLRGAA